MKRGYTLKNHSNIFYGNFRARPSLNGSRQLEMDLEKIYNAMEKGHKVCKLLLLKKWDPSYKKLLLNRDTQQIVLSKFDSTLPSSSAPSVSSVAGVAATKSLATLDVRLIKEAHSLDYKLNTIRVADRWRKDKDIQRFNAEMILVISYGSAFVLNHWILLFESKDTCRLWADGINNLRREIASTSHYLLVERWLRKQFHSIVNSDTSTVTLKHMRPFVQTKLQCKVQSKQLQEIAEGEMGFEAFATAHNRLLNFDAIFVEKFAEFGEKPNADAADAGAVVSLVNFVRFINEAQGDELGRNVEAASNFLRHYLRDVDLSRDVLEPHLTSEEFVDFLYSSENSIFNPLNNEVVQDMTRPLTHYWIASSHNTYLTGDQLRSESSLEAYSRALIMGCRCIELDCWDGQRKMSGEFSEIVIYHGYTMTSKLNLRDVLYTIKHYAFMTSRYPLILSIENNCSVPAQRKMAQDIKEILGDFLLVAPVSRDEWQLPSPEAMRNKIILKHKKLQLDDDALISAAQSVEEELDQDLLSKECIKRGVLYLRDNTKHLWSRHIFLLFSDRLCYILRPVENEDLCARDPRDDQQTEDESGSVGSWQDSSEDQLMSVFGVRPEEMHITEEWFHGKVGRDVAKDRLMEHADKGNGVFLVRESGTFIGDYTLSFFQNGNINHCRIKTAMVDGNKKFYFFDNLKRDTLYELISHYTRHAIDAPSFKAYLLTPCPQPQPHLNEPWFSGEADKQRAEELLSTVKEDGAFLIRYSASDRNVFVLSLRVNGEFWHYRLKRDGRIFVVNQMIFENLNQIVDFYSNRDFVRGICLKYPINERTMGRYARNDGLLASSGCYMELKDLDKEEEVISIKSFLGVNVEHLSFPAGVRIQVLARNADLWKGRYLGRMGWFPADCVQPVHNENDEAAAEAAMSYETIELGGSVFARCESDRPFAFRVTQSTSPWNVQEYIVATESREEMDEWLNAMHSAARTFNDRINLLRFKEKQLRIASELSSLVVYCQAVPFNADFALSNPRQSFYEMCSFSESKHDKLLEKGLALFNTRQLSRVYPQASRLTSTNFNPTPMWNSGCHMVALNYQTGDRSMQLNYGKFSANGRCGYVLKPQYMMDETFRLDPLAVPQAQTVDVVSSTNGLQKSASMANACENFPICLTLQIIAGRHLAGKDHTKGICSPFVQVEVTGFACDSRVERTNTITSNGLNPMWNETMVFNVLRPEVALLRFLVEDGDFVGPKTDPFIGQAVFPMDCIRGGYRSIPLLNQFNEPLELSALLVHVRIRSLTNVPVRNLHAHLQAGRLAAAANNHSNNNNALSAELAEEPEASVPHTLADLTPATLGATPSSATLLSPSDATTPSTRRHSATTLLHASSTRLNNDAAPTAGHGIDAVLSSAASTPDQSPSQTTSMDSYDDNAPITGSMSSTISSVKKPSSNALRRIFRIGRNT